MRMTAERVASPGRYARHALIPDWSQPALAAASVVVIGVGAVGSEVARLLAQAGVGRAATVRPGFGGGVQPQPRGALRPG